ncbi:MAG TPA: D-alanyl-D-alanine carboxypeptidase family protein [Methylomirabilota bacterium]|nr:D-alanyl-D-alanine carboxypeptidase family protein [Methylomirabilota bacterium]
MYDGGVRQKLQRCAWREWWLGIPLLVTLAFPAFVDARRPAQNQERSPAQNAEDVEERVPAKKSTAGGKAEPYKHAILIEAESGKVLFEKDAHTPSPPASMVKMMTTLIAMEKIQEGALHLTDTVTVSRWAAQMGGSQVYLKEGETQTVEALLKAIMIHSANDATAAIAEYIAGSTDAFVDLMNDKAEQLGLKETHFYSVHGLPAEAGQKDDEMSAHDLAMLGRELLKYPEAAKWAATMQEPFRDGQFTLVNPNHLLRQYQGADGIKTGYHNRAGFCVTGSAKRADLRLIVVVMGSSTKRDCFNSAAQLLNQGFANYRMYVPVKQGAAIGREAPIRGGVEDRVAVVPASDVKVLLKRGDEKKVQVEVNIPDRVSAPVKAGQVVGDIVVKLDGAEVGKTQATAAQDVAQASFWKRWWPF